MKIECEEIKHDIKKPKIVVMLNTRKLVIRKTDKNGEELVISFTPKETEEIQKLLKYL